MIWEYLTFPSAVELNLLAKRLQRRKKNKKTTNIKPFLLTKFFNIMSNKLTNILRGRPLRRVPSTSSGRAQCRPWQFMLLAALFAWLLPQQALADGDFNTYVDMSYNYGVSLDGSNTVKIHVPVYVQEGADCWIKDGKLKVSIAGGSEITLFEWKASEDIDGDATKCWTNFSTEADGYIMVTLGNTSNTVIVIL